MASNGLAVMEDALSNVKIPKAVRDAMASIPEDKRYEVFLKLALDNKDTKVEQLRAERTKLEEEAQDFVNAWDERYTSNTEALRALGVTADTSKVVRVFDRAAMGRVGRSGGGGGTRMTKDQYEEMVVACLRKSDNREAQMKHIMEYVEENGGSKTTLQQSIMPALVKEGKVESPSRGIYRLPDELVDVK